MKMKLPPSSLTMGQECVKKKKKKVGTKSWVITIIHTRHVRLVCWRPILQNRCRSAPGCQMSGVGVIIQSIHQSSSTRMNSGTICYDEGVVAGMKYSSPLTVGCLRVIIRGLIAVLFCLKNLMSSALGLSASMVHVHYITPSLTYW